MDIGEVNDKRHLGKDRHEQERGQVGNLQRKGAVIQNQQTSQEMKSTRHLHFRQDFQKIHNTTEWVLQ